MPDTIDVLTEENDELRRENARLRKFIIDLGTGFANNAKKFSSKPEKINQSMGKMFVDFAQICVDELSKQ